MRKLQEQVRRPFSRLRRFSVAHADIPDGNSHKRRPTFPPTTAVLACTCFPSCHPFLIARFFVHPPDQIHYVHQSLDLHELFPF